MSFLNFINKEKDIDNTIESTQSNSKFTQEEEITQLEIFPRVIDEDILQFKFLNISYRRIGKTLALFFNSSSGIPYLVIGPHWPLYFVLLIIINTVILVLYKKFFSFFLPTIPTIGYFILYISLLMTLTLNVIINPGIIYREESYNQIGRYCNKCNAFIQKGVSATHCNFCNVCIEDLDHHCVWVGKCVGKRTIKLFYCLIGNIILIYAHMIGSIIYYYTTIKPSK